LPEGHTGIFLVFLSLGQKMSLSNRLSMMLPLFFVLLTLFSCANSSGKADTPASPVGVREANSNMPEKAGALTLVAPRVNAQSGQTVCGTVTVNDFDEIISMQYTLAWDPKVLKFSKLQKFELPMFGMENFGTHLVAEGMLTSVWIDMSLEGISRSPGYPIYEICFDVIGQPGTSSPIEFRQTPTPFEVVNAKEKILELNGVAGAINVQL
jgi:hypothetical protein